MSEFELWLECEAWGSEEDFCNAKVTLPDGRAYALNVWTFEFLERARVEAAESGECLAGTYILPPDLFVEELSRACLERVVADLLASGGLSPAHLLP